MGRSIAAVVAGFLAMSVTVMIATLIAAGLLTGGPAGAAGAGYLAANLAYSGLFAMLGGWVTARLAVTRPARHVMVLASIVGVLGAATALAGPQPGQPAWYPWAITVIGVGGIMLGGRIRRRAA